MNMECHQRKLIVNVPSDVFFLMKERDVVCKGLPLTILYWPVFPVPRSISIHPSDKASSLPWHRKHAFIDVISSQKKGETFLITEGFHCHEEPRAFALSWHWKKHLKALWGYHTRIHSKENTLLISKTLISLFKNHIQ